VKHGALQHRAVPQHEKSVSEHARTLYEQIILILDYYLENKTWPLHLVHPLQQAVADPQKAPNHSNHLLAAMEQQRSFRATRSYRGSRCRDVKYASSQVHPPWTDH